MALAVKSAVKSLAKKKKMRVSGDFWKALDAMITESMKKAADRAKSNGRKTIRGDDL